MLYHRSAAKTLQETPASESIITLCFCYLGRTDHFHQLYQQSLSPEVPSRCVQQWLRRNVQFKRFYQFKTCPTCIDHNRPITECTIYKIEKEIKGFLDRLLTQY